MPSCESFCKLFVLVLAILAVESTLHDTGATFLPEKVHPGSPVVGLYLFMYKNHQMNVPYWKMSYWCEITSVVPKARISSWNKILQHYHVDEEQLVSAP